MTSGGEAGSQPRVVRDDECDVSVVVPVYNTGQHLHFCVDSLLRQSLSPDRWEAIFVDDGSTDGTGQVLDDLARKHANFVVVHQENSGWPGKPRNVGVDRARGRYLFFMDHDDALGDEALERLVAVADRDDADIVIGKMVGQGRIVPRELFRCNRSGATLDNAPLLDSLTPHKLFRSSFVTRHALRFPEGRRRLEDHVFVVRSYFLARSISVLADYPCYYHVRRDDAGNAAFRPIEPVGYYANLREVLDIIEGYTEPGPDRDRLLRRAYRVEVLRRLTRGELLRLDPADREALLTEVRRIALERFGEGVVAGLSANLRVVSELARAGDLDGLLAQAQFERSLVLRPFLRSLSWDGDSIDLAFDASVEVEGEPVAFEVVDGRPLIPVAPRVRSVVTANARDVEQELPDAKVDLLLRERTSKTEFYVPLESFRHDEPTREGFTVSLQGTAAVRPTAAAAGHPLGAGRWDLWVRVSLCGWTQEARLGQARAPGLDDACRALPVGTPLRLVAPYWTEPGSNLTVRVVAPRRVLDAGKCTARTDGRRVVIEMPLRAALESAVPATLVLRGTLRTVEVPLEERLPDRHRLEWAATRRLPLLPVGANASGRLVLGAGRSSRVDLDLPPLDVLRPRVVATAKQMRARGSSKGR